MSISLICEFAFSFLEVLCLTGPVVADICTGRYWSDERLFLALSHEMGFSHWNSTALLTAMYNLYIYLFLGGSGNSLHGFSKTKIPADFGFCLLVENYFRLEYVAITAGFWLWIGSLVDIILLSFGIFL